MKLHISHFAGYAPGLESLPDWQRWAAQPEPPLPVGDAVPALSEMPALQRRRLDRAGRLALHVAWQCQPQPESEVPQVFASRHGDVGRTYRMLEQLAAEASVSPTQFGLSTHNAIAAQYSIARAFTGNYAAIAAGTATAEAAICEAQGLLADGAPAVLVVVYDEPLPEDYAAFDPQPQAAYAWAVRVVQAGPEEAGFSLSAEASDASGAAGDPPKLPQGLLALRFLLSDATELVNHSGQTRWRWQRH